MLRLAEHPRIAGVKDCAYDLLGTQKVLARTDLAYYTGSEEFILPLYSVGGAGYVSTVANVAPHHLRGILDAYDAGDTAGAALRQQQALPLIELMMTSGLPGMVTAKALLGSLGLPAGPVRAPAAARRPGGGRRDAGGVRAAGGRLISVRRRSASSARPRRRSPYGNRSAVRPCRCRS